MAYDVGALLGRLRAEAAAAEAAAARCGASPPRERPTPASPASGSNSGSSGARRPASARSGTRSPGPRHMNGSKVESRTDQAQKDTLRFVKEVQLEKQLKLAKQRNQELAEEMVRRHRANHLETERLQLETERLLQENRRLCQAVTNLNTELQEQRHLNPDASKVRMENVELAATVSVLKEEVASLRETNQRLVVALTGQTQSPSMAGGQASGKPPLSRPLESPPRAPASPWSAPPNGLGNKSSPATPMTFSPKIPQTKYESPRQRNTYAAGQKPPVEWNLASNANLIKDGKNDVGFFVDLGSTSS